jgi:N-acetylglucosaminyldiphosphoundecaprenol N-acetyl-beta-D-mannosaminyltransferase
MLDHGKKNVLGVRVDAVDYAAAVERVIDAATEPRGYAVTALAVHGVMTGVTDPAHRHRLNTFDLVVPDGQPVRWALNLLHGAGLGDRVYGPALMLEVCRAAAGAGLPIYLYGSRKKVLARLCERLRSLFPELRIAGAQPSRFRRISPGEREEIAREIRGSGARITFVGLGCPRQEVWAYENVARLGMPVLAVGAAFDFHAGLLPQAPPRLQSKGLEWAFRLYQEPKRLWRRYLYLNPLYLALLALQLLGIRSFEAAETRAPETELLYG